MSASPIHSPRATGKARSKYSESACFLCLMPTDCHVKTSHSPWPRTALLPQHLVLPIHSNCPLLFLLLPTIAKTKRGCHHLPMDLQRSGTVILASGSKYLRGRLCLALLPRCKYDLFIWWCSIQQSSITMRWLTQMFSTQKYWSLFSWDVSSMSPDSQL